MVLVIGTGFGRTGTTSTKAALERLTGGRCYHMFEALSHLDHLPAWLDADAGDKSGLRNVLAGYSATVDWPGCGLWRTLISLFPDAAVLVTTRPAELWWNSYRQTIHRLMLREVPPEEEVGPEIALMSRFGDRLVKRSFPPGYADLTRVELVAAYERHQAEILATVPSDRVLRYDVEDGWEPLCALLGVPVPEEDFPRLNDQAAFVELFGLDRDPEVREQPYTRDELERRFGGAARPAPGG